MTTGHPDFDALSAHLDGEAPEIDAHAAACAGCQATLARLRTVSALIAAPPPVSASTRDQVIARAMDESMQDSTESRSAAEVDRPAALAAQPLPAPTPLPGRREPVPPRSSMSPVGSRRRDRGSGLWIGVGSAAAVLVAFVAIGLGALSGGGGGGGNDGATVAAGAPPSEDRAANGPDAVGDASATTGTADDLAPGAGGIDGGDLGDITDATTLADASRPALVRRQMEVARAPLPAPAIPEAGAGATASGSGGPLGADSGLVPKVIGTRPCEMEARAARPGLGTVVYFAVGRVEGAPVVVLGFESDPELGSVRLLALAQQEGCRVVLEAAGP